MFRVEGRVRRSWVVLLFCAAWLRGSAWAQDSAVRQEPVPPGAEVVVALGAGTLSVVGWDRQEVEITSPTASVAEALQVSREGGKIHLELGATESGLVLAGELHLKLPHKSTLQIASTSAGVVVSGMTGDLVVQTDAGNVDVSAPEARSVHVATVAGAVDIRSEAEVLTLETVSGSIRFRGRGAVTVNTVSGSVRIDGELTGTSEIRAVSARVDLEGSLAPSAQLAVSSHTGDVQLRLLTADAVRFELSTFDGRITRNGERVRVAGPGGEVAFDLGSPTKGGRRVEIGTFSGEISLHDPANR